MVLNACISNICILYNVSDEDYIPIEVCVQDPTAH